VAAGAGRLRLHSAIAFRPASGQIGMLETVIASNPSAIVIAPARSVAIKKPIENAAKKTKIVGIDSDEESLAFASSLKTDNIQVGRLAADVLADAIKRTYADAEGDVAIITSSIGVGSIDERARGFKEQVATKYGALDVVAHKIGGGQSNTGYSTMMDLISEYPELRGVFGLGPGHGQRSGASPCRQEDEHERRHHQFCRL
jgi:ribose transport system substrate-binding protein